MPETPAQSSDDRLRALAHAATPGPWRYESRESEHLVVPPLTQYPVARVRGDNIGYCDARFIAACSPDVVLALLDRAQTAEEDAALLRKHLDRQIQIVGEQLRRAHTAEAELAVVQRKLAKLADWAFTVHGGIKSPVDVWPELGELLE